LKAPLRVLLMQLPVPNNPALNTPLAAGYLASYAAAQGLLDAVAITILPRRLADSAGDALLIEEIVARQPDVLGISLYTWNSERSLALAWRVKQRLPRLRVVVGGPEVQRDNPWLLDHPAVDIAVVGEGEQTFASLLRLWLDEPDDRDEPLARIPGIAYRHAGTLRFTDERVPLTDLMLIPSPYLHGYLDVPPDGMLMVEVSRWCPYACSFCLYGRNMGPRLGNRLFALERVLSEIAWGRAQSVRRVHFVEANLNLVPLFWPLMRALADLNADKRMTFYAELRGEHLTDDVVAALDRANVRYVEVGLQTANPLALKASRRRTDLRKWAAGTRRLYTHGIEVYLDVILGLPADDQAGVAETLDFIQREDLGSYDVFTLQVLPGTAVRQQAAEYGLRFQDRPPYYILETDRLSYAELRRLRRDLKHAAGLAPDAVEGLPEPHPTALLSPARAAHDQPPIITQIWLAADAPLVAVERSVERLALHVDLALRAEELATHTPALAAMIARNPATLFDVYLLCDDDVPGADAFRRWRAGLPYAPGYLDRVAVYRAPDPAIPHQRVSPRCFLVLPWTATIEPAHYDAVAEIIWRFVLEPDDTVPYRAWYAAAGAGIWLDFAAACTPSYRAAVVAAVRAWECETGRRVWLADACDAQAGREVAGTQQQDQYSAAATPVVS
jgi:radical SAM superfamily enzyme YgiQ (UPF0313 family)